MKKLYLVLLSIAICLGICNQANAQTISTTGTVFLPQDSIGITFSKPGFTATDWIGIYKTDQVPSESTPSIYWKYIPTESGTLYLETPNEAGKYKAIMLCCDGYDIVATSEEFSIEIPSLETSFPNYVEGDSIVLSYISPKFSATDKLAIYPNDVVPGEGNEPLDWKYITAISGDMTFKTALADGMYTAYLLCCDGYDTIATDDFEVIDQATPFLTLKKSEFAAGASIDIYYNDPSFAADDRIDIYIDGEMPGSNSLTYSEVVSKSGIVTFPGVLPEGAYYAVLSCCNSPSTEYARSEAFLVNAPATGSYVKTSAPVYPASTSIFVNYKDEDRADKDWIGIYKKGNIPGGPEATVWQYVTKDSSTVEFDALPLGEYVVYLLCCDGYEIKSVAEFKVVGPNIPTLITSAFSFAVGETIEFIFNDPDYPSGGDLDWIGIYRPEDIPLSVRSMIWEYNHAITGTMTFSVPYANGTWPEENVDTPLVPGEYKAYLFCCDTYGVYAWTNFVITEFPSGVNPLVKSDGNLSVYPNPTTGLVNIRLKEGGNMQKIVVYNIAGQVIYEESPKGTVSQKVLDLKLDKGIYFMEVVTEKYRTSQKLIIQ